MGTQDVESALGGKKVAPKKGLTSIYLYIDEGPLEAAAALEFLAKYPDDAPDADPDDPITVRKVSEVRLDRLRETDVIVPIVRDIRLDRNVSATMPSGHPDKPDRLVQHEKRGPVFECKPVAVSKFYTRAKSRDGEDSFDESGLVNAIGAVCMPAAPRIRRRGDGKGNHNNWLTLRWG